MPPTRRLRAAGLATLFLVAAACSVEDPTPSPGAEAEFEVLDEAAAVPQVRVTPAESAAAAVPIRAHADSVGRAARAQAGLPAEDGPAPSRASGPAAPTAEAEYAACIAQARAAEGHPRALIERACEDRRRAREGGPE